MGGEEEKKGDEEKKPSPYTLSKEQIAEIPLGGFRGRITVAYTPQKADEAASFLSRYHFLGFDTETKPVFKKGQKQNPIALIQLSTERHAFLFRVSETGMTPALKEILESPKIRKIGQAMKHELVTMKKELKVEGRGFIDLLDIAHRLECEPKSVKGMAAIFLGIRISKSMQVTNWERRVLSDKQKRYAATDAWACLAIYDEIRKRKLVENPEKTRHR